MPEISQAAMSPDEDNVSQRIRFSEIGYLGLKISNKQVLEEPSPKLRYPEFYRVVDEMSKDSVIATGLAFMRMMIGRASWKVRIDSSYSDKAKQRAKFLEQNMRDMEHSWDSFISEVSSFIPYGYSIHEKSYRKRLKRAGSKFNDGLIGIKSLYPRSQSSIKDWKFDGEGRKLLSVIQTTSNASTGFERAFKEPDVEIPRDKILLFTCDGRLNNPLGNSPLKSVYLTWQTRKSVEEQELVGLSRDLGGIPVLRAPAAIMSDSANDGQKAQYEYLKNVARNLHANRQAGLVLPSDVDENTKNKFYDIDLLTAEGGKNYDVNKVIERLNNQILTALFADVLTIGQTGTGSFSLADSKVSLTEFALRYRLQEIKDVLNQDLIPSLWALNKWDMDELPYFDFELPDATSLEEFSKAIQRIAATSSIEKDRAFFNLVRVRLGLEPYPEDKEVDWDTVVVDMSSRSGDGMEQGLGSGTGNKSGSEGNSSDMNSDNNA